MIQRVTQQHALVVEESRATSVDLEQFRSHDRFSNFLSDLTETIPQRPNDELLTLVTSQAKQLWSLACEHVTSGVFDDRPLYWTRLKAQIIIRNAIATSSEQHGKYLSLLLSTFDWYSRGFDDLFSLDDNTTAPIILTGFDPFGLDNDIGQSNPSGVAALYLSSRSVGQQRVSTAIFPVRFRSFDLNLVEATLATRIAKCPRFLLTSSMGRKQFDLERFTSARRTSAALDNESESAVEGGKEPFKFQPESTEFLEYSLPTESMCAVDSDWLIRDNRNVRTVESGHLDAYELDEINAQTAVSGSGGGFLSNEIAHRVLWMKHQAGAHFPAGHLHVPKLQGYDEATAKNIAETVEKILGAGVDATLNA